MTGYKHALKIGFYIFAENLAVRFSPSFACNKLVTMLQCEQYSCQISVFLNNSFPCFVQYIHAKFCEILTSGSREISTFPRELLN